MAHDLPAVAGELNCSLADVEFRARTFLRDEQQRPNPDTALVALLCDTVRLAREYCNSVDGKGLRSLIEGEPGA